ncbi:hypothetical protein BDY21DRAFT_211891 [Lineolata rhizophorae]|uniref:Uncharacterized protein n=1 Tax=Lineolata rhizophorae TaxID=578093 RepID=A0A6A6P483_9PEZI|nr:hypothetical protein BDY21DRAFT_211891 [Lineolata rhizophorae]
MADGLNDARALRVAEIMTDFRNLQHYIAAIRASPTAEEYYLEGYTILRACVAEAQALLAAPPFPETGSGGGGTGDGEAEKRQLRSVIYDASIRRFQCQRAYLRATAAMRWINSRAAVLHGDRPSSAHAAQLAQVDQSLRTELASITDERVHYSLYNQDATEGKWTAEDPPLEAIQASLAR